jgi:hypothetical protein
MIIIGLLFLIGDFGLIHYFSEKEYEQNYYCGSSFCGTGFCDDFLRAFFFIFYFYDIP